MPPLRNVVFGGAVARAVFGVVNRFVDWYRLPLRLGLLNLDAFRYVLRRDNLIDTETARGAAGRRARCPGPTAEDERVARTFDGT